MPVRRGGDTAVTGVKAKSSGHPRSESASAFAFARVLPTRSDVSAARLPISLVSPDLADGTLAHQTDFDTPYIALWAQYPTRRLQSACAA